MITKYLLTLIITSFLFSQGTYEEISKIYRTDILDLINHNDTFYSIANNGELFVFDESSNTWGTATTLPDSGYMKMASVADSIYIFLKTGKVYKYLPFNNQLLQLPSVPFIEQNSDIIAKRIQPITVGNDVFIIVPIDTTNISDDSDVYMLRYSYNNTTIDSIHLGKMDDGPATSNDTSIFFIMKRGWIWPDQDMIQIDPADNWNTSVTPGPPFREARYFEYDNDNFYFSPGGDIYYSQNFDGWFPLYKYSQDPSIHGPKGFAIKNNIPYIIDYDRWSQNNYSTFRKLNKSQDDTTSFQFKISNQNLVPNGSFERTGGIKLGDIDNDGDLDLIILYGSENSGIQVEAYFNDGLGNFGPSNVIYSLSGLNFRNININPTSTIGLSDINNDGHLDIILGLREELWGDFNNWGFIFLNDGSGNFSRMANDSLKITNVFETNDFDLDGYIDIITRERGGMLLRGKTDSWKPHFQNLPLYSYLFKTGDLNSDGLPDLISTRSEVYPVMSFNNGNGQMINHIKFGTETGTKIAINDMNTDGVSDIIVSTNRSSTSASDLDVLTLNSDGSILHIDTIDELTVNVQHVLTPDFDLDGFSDIIVALTGTTNSLNIYRNFSGNGYYLRSSLFPPVLDERWGDGSFDVGDVNGDYKLDIVFGSYLLNQNSNTIFINETETPPITIPVTINNLDANVNQDVVVLDWGQINGNISSYQIKITRNDGWTSSRGNPNQPMLINNAKYVDLQKGNYEATVRYFNRGWISSNWSNNISFTISDDDDIAPNPVSNFNAEPYLPFQTLAKLIAPSGSANQLAWTNPTDTDFDGVKIIRRTDRYPININDGILIYNGYENMYLDSTNVDAEKSYYYSAFAYDEVENISTINDDSQTVVLSERSDPPTIFHYPIKYFAKGYPIKVEARLRDDFGIKEAVLHYKKGNSSRYISINMSSLDIDYAATIATYDNNLKIQYYITTSDGQNAISLPANAPASTFTSTGLASESILVGSVFDVFSRQPLSNIQIALWSEQLGLLTTIADEDGIFYFDVPPGTYEIETYGLPENYYASKRTVEVIEGNNFVSLPEITISYEEMSGLDFLDIFDKNTSDSPRPHRFPLHVYPDHIDSGAYYQTYNVSVLDTLKLALKAWEDAAFGLNLFILEQTYNDSIDINVTFTDEGLMSGRAGGTDGEGGATIFYPSLHTTGHEIGHVLGFSHPHLWDAGGIMSYLDPTPIPREWEGKALSLCYHIKYGNNRKPNIEPYFIRVVNSTINSINIDNLNLTNGSVNVPIETHIIMKGIVNDVDNDSLRTESSLRIINQTNQQSWVIPMIQDQPNNELFHGTIFISGRDIDHPYYVSAFPGDTLHILNDINNVLGSIIVGAALLKEHTNNLNNYFSLSQNYPNPFNPITEIQFTLPQKVNVSLIIYNILGQAILKPISNIEYESGAYTFMVDMAHFSGGIYFYSIETEQWKDIKKMILLK